MKTQKINENPFESVRDAMLSIYDIGEEISAFGYGLRLMQSLRLNIINNDQFDLLLGSMQKYCNSINLDV